MEENEDIEMDIEKIDGVPVLTLSQPVFLVRYKCNKCGYKWTPKNPKPSICPECKNDWTKERVYRQKGDDESE